MRIACDAGGQIEQVQVDALRVVISGAGVAGVALAQLLRRQGMHPVVIEGASFNADKGYMLGLMPLVGPTMAGLGVEEAYRAHSVGVERYLLGGRHGQHVRTYDLGELVAAFGEYRGLSRGDLLDVLTADNAPVSFDTTIIAVTQIGDDVRVTLSTGEVVEADLLVIAEGIHSSTRDLVFAPDQISTYDSGWGGWVAWMPSDDASDLYEEIWGAGFFIGTYPVRGQIGAFIGGDRKDTCSSPATFVGRIHRDISSADLRVQRALEVVAKADDPYYWHLLIAGRRRGRIGGSYCWEIPLPGFFQPPVWAPVWRSSPRSSLRNS